MRIHPLLSTEEREKILGYLLMHPSEKINMNGVARELGLSPGQVHKYVSILRKEGLVEKDEWKEVPLAHSLRLLFNIKKVGGAGIVDVLRRELPGVEGIGIFGSWASGTNAEGSDLDIWVKMGKEPEELAVAKARKRLEGKVGVPVDIVIATPERMKHFREKSDAFYFSLYNGRILWGEGL
jgi:predicted nucleotidyltransferase/DNA-directed RNA polymerase subunit H (RpoH/RPB5)